MFFILFYFIVQLTFLSFKLTIQISHSLKEIIMIIKPHYKFTTDIIQIIDKYNLHGHYPNN